MQCNQHNCKNCGITIGIELLNTAPNSRALAMNNDSNHEEKSGISPRGKKRKSRWDDEKQAKERFQCMSPALPNTMSSIQQESYILQQQINELSKQLLLGDLSLPSNLQDRSPSPPPIYDHNGKRLNTRANRARQKLEEQRHQLITRMQTINPNFVPPLGYKPPGNYHTEKIILPQDEYPHINFIGVLIGPRGNTIKALEKETGTKIAIRGKGSSSPSKVASIHQSSEPLHVFIWASNSEAVANAAKRIQEVIEKGIADPSYLDHLRKQQLYTLAELNGTIRHHTDGHGSSRMKSYVGENASGIVCSTCGGSGHITSDCKLRSSHRDNSTSADDDAKFDEQYLALMEELNEKPSKSIPHPPQNITQQDVVPESDTSFQWTAKEADGNEAAAQQKLISKEPKPALLGNNPLSLPNYNWYNAGITFPGTSASPYETPQSVPSQIIHYPQPGVSTPPLDRPYHANYNGDISTLISGTDGQTLQPGNHNNGDYWTMLNSSIIIPPEWELCTFALRLHQKQDGSMGQLLTGYPQQKWPQRSWEHPGLRHVPQDAAGS
uniref:Branchpoint-bridging protein n=1 Tax=Anopheles culicifacies TaxID=139723 RepID=A0A182MQC5_9DIPT